MCDAELDNVQDYNQHYLDNHPPTPCPYCPRLFSLPRTMAKHKYSHDEIMYECETCGRGFTFKSQYDSHHRVHLKIQGYVCFKANCGQWFKCESELNAHLKAHTSKPISCEYCNYKNTDKRNVRAHMRVHSDELPFFVYYVGNDSNGKNKRNGTCQTVPVTKRSKLSVITVSDVILVCNCLCCFTVLLGIMKVHRSGELLVIT